MMRKCLFLLLFLNACTSQRQPPLLPYEGGYDDPDNYRRSYNYYEPYRVYDRPYNTCPDYQCVSMKARIRSENYARKTESMRVINDTSSTGANLARDIASVVSSLRRAGDSW